MNLLEEKTVIIVGAVTVVSIVAAFLIKKAATAATGAASAAANAVNPLNNDNLFATGVNKVVQQATGDNTQTMGGWIYDVTHNAHTSGATAPANTPNTYQIPPNFGMQDPNAGW
jgi:uncharacterized protein (UPF0333 family)